MAGLHLRELIGIALDEIAPEDPVLERHSVPLEGLSADNSTAAGTKPIAQQLYVLQDRSTEIPAYIDGPWSIWCLERSRLT